MNLLELGATLERVPTPDGARSPLALAEAHDLGVLVNRPPLASTMPFNCSWSFAAASVAVENPPA